MNKDAGALQRPRRRRFRGWLGIVVALSFPAGAAAQSKPQFPQDDTQVWTDAEAAHALRENVHLILNGGLRWSDDAGHLVYRRVGAGLSYRWRKYLTLSPSYSFFYRDTTRTSEASENRISLAATFTAPLGRWKLSDRNLFENRFINGGQSRRYRNRVELERGVKLGGTLLRVFVSDEVFYDSAVHAWARNRAAIGAGKEISRYLSIDLYYLRQNDSHTSPGDLNAIGMTLRTHF